MAVELSYLKRLGQRFEKIGSSLFIRTLLDDVTPVNSLEIQNVTPDVPSQVISRLADDLLARACIDAGSGGGGLGPVVLTGVPTAGQVPVATSDVTATWQTPSGGSGVPDYTSTVAVSVTTTATPGTGAYVAFPAQACNALVIDNQNRHDIDIQRGGTGAFITIPAGTRRTIVGITDAAQIGVRRSDWATPVQVRVSTTVAQALVGGSLYSGIVITSVAITNGGGWATFPSNACVCMELLNTTGKDVRYRLNGAGTVFKVKHNHSVLIYGITNSNQVGLQSATNTIGFNRDVQAELFLVPMRDVLSEFRRSSVADEMRVEFNDFLYANAIPPGLLYGPSMSTERRRLVKKGVKPLAIFQDVASTTSNVSANLADVTVGEFLYGQSALEYTCAGTTTASFYPKNVPPSTVNVMGGNIYLRYAFVDGTPNFTAANISARIRLYSDEATPATPGTVYLEASLNTQWADCGLNPSGINGGPIQADGFALDIAKFTQVGAGVTDPMAIKFASVHFVITSAPVGAKLRLFDIQFAPKARNVGSVIFTFDDIHWGQYQFVAPLLAKYGWPAVLCIDTINKMKTEAGALTYNASSPVMSYANVLALQNHFGWQLTSQVYDFDTGIQRNPSEWTITAEKARQFLLAMGASGVADTSYGSGTYSNIDDERLSAAKRMYRSAMLFKGGNTVVVPGTASPRVYGEQLPFGNPYRIQRMNMSGFTAGNVYNSLKNYVDQAVAEKGVSIFAAHGEFNDPATWGTSEISIAFMDLCAYIRTLEVAGQVEVHTLDSLIRETYK